MWLLESPDAFEGRRLWLRPGKTYLFGRTAAEPGQLAISHNTISRKHLTITIDQVERGHAHHLPSRSKMTIEDLATKIGTVVNGEKIKGAKYVVPGEEAEIVMGKCPSKFRISWFPVVFTFSFTSKELQAQPLATLQEQFEQLDIKLLTDYNVQSTTHVVSRKRNTAKGLQALINGKYVVTETFLDAVTRATQQPEDGDALEPSALEQDFSQNWPDPMQHLPPRGGEPVQHPDSTYSPDHDRQDVFDGYTFIFYDQTQYNNLLAPITTGCGKALLQTVNPRKTEVDDFVRYVKSVAGEKGLGCFEDGSEGKGVVLVRYLPAKGELVAWYTEFLTAVSLRLDHRPIEQNEFLEAILIKDASILRRPLEMESSMPSQESRLDEQSQAVPAMQSSFNEIEAVPPASEAAEDSQPPPRQGNARRPVKRRFAGFDDDIDDVDVDMDDSPTAAASAAVQQQDEEGGLFVSQEDASQASDAMNARKRGPPAQQEDDLMEGMAPAAARFKRQRIERGEDFATPPPEPVAKTKAARAAPKKKKSKEMDVLAMAAQHREAEEARARAEKEDLANLPADADLAEIRRLNIVEEMDVHVPDKTARSRDQNVTHGRWDPRWNGVKNFKKFRRRGEAQGRQPARTIVSLTEVKTKEYGVGDNYWLEDGEGSQRKKGASSHPSAQDTFPSIPVAASSAEAPAVTIPSDDDDDDDDDVVLPSAASRARNTGRSATRSQGDGNSTPGSQSQSQNKGKRSAGGAAAAPPPKRPRQTTRLAEIANSDDSDDELKFRFGKRR